jgi:SAM-dependent methyltransferase
MKNPHDSWANVYEFVYEQCFGSFYQGLTDELLRIIKSEPNKGSVIDFGAGTGRLAIPLAQSGYEVHAVEISKGMCDELMAKASALNLSIDVHNCSIADYNNKPSELAICIFTVLSYITTETEMERSITNIGKHIVSGGHFLFDLPMQVLFQGSNYNRPNIRRNVTITPVAENNVYHYQENCEGIFNGQHFQYEDKFNIRYWQPDVINAMLNNAGLFDTGAAFPQLQGTYANYKLYKKI